MTSSRPFRKVVETKERDSITVDGDTECYNADQVHNKTSLKQIISVYQRLVKIKLTPALARLVIPKYTLPSSCQL